MTDASQTQKKILRITLVKSPIGYSKPHKATIRALGLRKMHQTVEHVDSPACVACSIKLTTL